MRRPIQVERARDSFVSRLEEVTEAFGASFLRDTLPGQIQLQWDTFEHHHPEAGYSIFQDQQLVGREHLLPIVARSESPEETAAILQRMSNNAEMDRRIHETGAFATRLLAQLANPTNLVPVFRVAGIGLKAGAASGAAQVTGLVAAEEVVHAQIDPEYTAQQAVFTLGASALLGGAVGALAGKYGTPRPAVALEDRGPVGRGLARIGAQFDALFRESEGIPQPRSVDEVRIRNARPAPGTTDNITDPNVIEPTPLRWTGTEALPDRTRLVELDNGVIAPIERYRPDQPRPLVLADGAGTAIEPARVRSLMDESGVRIAEGPAGEGPPRRPADTSADGTYGIAFEQRRAADVPSQLRKVEQRATTTRTKADEANLEVQRLDNDAGELRQRAATAKSKGWATRWSAQAKALEDQAAELRTRAESLDTEARIAEDDLAEVHTPVGDARLQDMGWLGKMTGNQMPYARMKHTDLWEYDPDLAREGAELADHLVMGNGLRTRGNVQGARTEVGSVEAYALQWEHRAREAMDASMEAFSDLIGKGEKSARQSVFWARETQAAKQMGRAVANAGRRWTGRPEVEGWGKLQWQDFIQDVGRYLFDEDGQIPAGWSTEYRTAVEKAARAHTDFYTEVGQYLEQHNMLATPAALTRQIEVKTAYAGRLSSQVQDLKLNLRRLGRGENPALARAELLRWAEMHDRTGNVAAFARDASDAAIRGHIRNRGKKLSRLLDEFEAEQLEAEHEIENLTRLREEAVADISRGGRHERRYFPRYWRVDKISDNQSGLEQVLENWFMTHPDIVINGRRVQASTEPAAVRRRVAEMVENIKREGNNALTDTAAEGNEYVSELADRVVEIENELRLMQPMKQDDLLFEGPPTRIVDSDLKGTDYPYAMARVEADGTFSIHLDRPELRRWWDSGEARQQLGEYVDEGWSYDQFESFIIEHERAHTRHRQRISETVEEYEARINDTARRIMEGTEGRMSERALQKREQLEVAKRRYLEAQNQGGAGPSRFMGRSADIPTRDVAEWVETDAETVLMRYVRQVGPAIEMARKFGDHRMDAYFADLRARKLESAMAAELAGDTKAARGIEDSVEQVITDAQVLRDKVLGRFGLPENPDAITVRTGQFLRNWSIMALMGKAWLPAIMDAGRLHMAHGMSVFKGVVELLSRSEAMRLATREVEMMGLANEVATGARLNSIFEEAGDTVGRTLAERVAARGAQQMFIWNGMNLWTDTMHKIAGLLTIDRIFKDSEKLLAGTLDQGRVAELAHWGIDESVAERLMREWRNAGAQELDGMRIANSEKWQSIETQRLFRAIVARELHSQVMTPTAADKPNFLGSEVGKFVAQYKTFGIVATQKLLLAGIQQRDKRVLLTLASLYMLAMMIDRIKRPDWSDDSFLDKSFRAIETSGMTGIFGDLNKMTEEVSGYDFGLRPLLGVDPIDRELTPFQRAGAVLGPPVAQWGNLMWALTSPDASSNEVARGIRYVIPYNNLYWWDGVVRDIQRDTADLLED